MHNVIYHPTNGTMVSNIHQKLQCTSYLEITISHQFAYPVKNYSPCMWGRLSCSPTMDLIRVFSYFWLMLSFLEVIAENRTANKRNAKLFSPFQLTNFPNNPCIGSSTRLVGTFKDCKFYFDCNL